MFLSSLNKKESGLTLLEIIIAIAILSTAGLAVLNLFADNSRLVGRTRERSQALSQASSIMEDIKAIAINSVGEIDDEDSYKPDSFGEYLKEEIADEYNHDEDDWSDNGNGTKRLEAVIDGYEVMINLEEESDTLYEVSVIAIFDDEQEVELASLITAR